MRWYESLRRRSEIAYVRRSGRRAGAPTLTAYAIELRSSVPRVGITVSRSVGKAVVRNLVRRRIRGALDALGPPLSSPRTAFLFVLRPEAGTAPYARLAADVARVVARLCAE